MTLTFWIKLLTLEPVAFVEPINTSAPKMNASARPIDHDSVAACFACDGSLISPMSFSVHPWARLRLG